MTERVTSKAPDRLRHKSTASKAPSAFQVQRSRQVSPQSQLGASGGKASSMVSIVQAPLCRGQGTVPEDGIQGEVGGVAQQDTPHLWLLPLQDDASGVLAHELLEGAGAVPVQGTDNVVSSRRHSHPRKRSLRSSSIQRMAWYLLAKYLPTTDNLQSGMGPLGSSTARAGSS